jgi:hypothetical protein
MFGRTGINSKGMLIFSTTSADESAVKNKPWALIPQSFMALIWATTLSWTEFDR